MDSIKSVLSISFWVALACSALVYIACDLLEVDLALLGDAKSQTKFVVSTVLILLTLALVPLALRLMTLQHVKNDLRHRQEKAILKWGVVRIAILGGLLLTNMMLYYLFNYESSFGYLAIVVLLTFPFIYPSKSRCQTELNAASENDATYDEKEETDSDAKESNVKKE